MKTIRTKWSLAFLFILVSCQFTAYGAESNGKGLFVGDQPVSVIVLPTAPLENEIKGAEELNLYLEKMTGEKLEQVTFSPEACRRKGVIFLGTAAVEAGGFTQKEMETAGLEGYRIRVKDGNVFIAGGKYYGTYYGVHPFLEQLGAKFYSIDYEVVPGPAKIKIPVLDIVRKPVFEWRNFKGCNIRQGQHEQMFHSMVSTQIDPDLKWYVHWMHNSQYLVPFYKYGKEHPEYYARRTNGTFYAAGLKEGHGNLHICMSNPEVRKIAKQRLLEAMNKQKDRRLFSVSPSDGYGWCECEGCRALDSTPGIHTDRLLDFVNDLARFVRDQHPDKLILTLAYLKETGTPPQRLKPEPNVRIVLCPYTPEVQDKAHWFDHKLNRQFLPWYEGWVKCLPPGQLFIFDYPYADFRSLTFFPEHHFWRLKRYAQDGVRGIYYDGRDRFMFPLFDHVISRLAWEPELDYRPLVEDFIRSYYGPAAPAMQDIYDFMTKIAALEDRSQGPTIDMRKFVTTEECNELFRLFAKAEALAKDSPEHLARVKEEKGYLLFTDLMKHNPVMGTAKDAAVFKNRLGEYLTLMIKTPTRSLFPQKYLDRPSYARNWFWRTARLKISSDKVRYDPVVQKLLTDPQSVAISMAKREKSVELLPDAKGWRLPLDMSEGGEFCENYTFQVPARQNIFLLRTRATDYSTMRFRFNLPAVANAETLAIDGLDDDKPGATRIRIALNNKELFRGPNRFQEKDWATCRYPIPDGLLKQEANDLVIEDLEEGGNLYAQWLAVAGVRIETTNVVPAPPAKTLFLVHFDKGFNADLGANPEAQIIGGARLHPQGKWGGALDADYTDGKTWSLVYSALDNYQGEQGTVEMWVKPKWSPSDKCYCTIFRPFFYAKQGGMLLYKYTESPALSLLSYHDGSTIHAPVLDWKPDTWHHIAFTWDAGQGMLQVFTDGILSATNQGVKMDAEIPDGFFVGCMYNKQDKTAKALIDELRISDRVLWEGTRIGEKVFEVPTQPYPR